MNTLPTIRPLDALAQRINEEHSLLEKCARGMLIHARVIGELLLEAKATLKTDKAFGQWRQANTSVSQPQAWRYMEVSRRWAALSHSRGNDIAEVSIREFLGIVEAPKPASTAPKSNLPTFTEDDAEYALKIAARLDSDFEGERELSTG
jgi:hypothetical protein